MDHLQLQSLKSAYYYVMVKSNIIFVLLSLCTILIDPQYAPIVKVINILSSICMIYILVYVCVYLM